MKHLKLNESNLRNIPRVSPVTSDLKHSGKLSDGVSTFATLCQIGLALLVLRKNYKNISLNSSKCFFLIFLILDKPQTVFPAICRVGKVRERLLCHLLFTHIILLSIEGKNEKVVKIEKFLYSRL